MLGQVSADYVHAKHPCYPQSRQRMPQEPQEPVLLSFFFICMVQKNHSYPNRYKLAEVRDISQ